MMFMICLYHQQAVVVNELVARMVECIMHQNGNHVVQQIIICVPQKLLVNIINALAGNVHMIL